MGLFDKFRKSKVKRNEKDIFMKFADHDVVRTLIDFPDENIKKGETGTVVMPFSNPYEAYEVEFVNDDGTTRAMVTILPEHIEEVHW